jgi:UDP-3-O-[3-hydroxymyristoyl] glucosamine N-acyltransferase
MAPMPTSGTTLKELATLVAATLHGDGGVIVRRVGTLEHAGPDAITFLANPRLRAQLAATRAAAVIVSPADAEATALPRLVHTNPYATYARVAAILHPAPKVAPGIDATARIGDGASIDPSAAIGPGVVIGARARIGARVVIGAYVVVGDEVAIGDDAYIHPHVTFYARSVIGPRTIVHSGAVIGSDGFGNALDGARWIKIPQIGRAVIGADCEIGANTTIDRGAIDDTVIEDDVKLDNQIQVGHNCRIGAHTAIAGCVGIAGSADIGRNVKIGGAAMIAGHISICDGAVISAATAVITSVEMPGVYTGTVPALPHREWQHMASGMRRLRTLVARVTALERALRAQANRDEETR